MKRRRELTRQELEYLAEQIFDVDSCTYKPRWKIEIKNRPSVSIEEWPDGTVAVTRVKGVRKSFKYLDNRPKWRKGEFK